MYRLGGAVLTEDKAMAGTILINTSDRVLRGIDPRAATFVVVIKFSTDVNVGYLKRCIGNTSVTSRMI